jgi:hypothetical protein
LPKLLENEALPLRLRTFLSVPQIEPRRVEERGGLCEIEVRARVQQSDAAKRIEAIIGVGPMSASAVALTVTKLPATSIVVVR